MSDRLKDQIYEYVCTSWREIAPVRRQVIILLGVTALIGLVGGWYAKGGLVDAQVAIRDERIKQKDDLIGQFKDKSQSSTPEEVSKKIATLETEIAALNGWTFTDAHKKALKAAIEKEPKKIPILFLPVLGHPDATRLGYALMTFLGSQGWGSGIVDGDHEHSPTDQGIEIAVQRGTDPLKNEDAVALKRVFEGGGFYTHYTFRNVMPKGFNVLVVIGGFKQ